MRFKSIFLLLVMAGMATACARTDLRDCYTTDWFSLGQRDGLVGAPTEVFETYRATCREAEVAPDREAYEKGHQDGLRYYCTDQNGFRVGRARKPYHHVCPPGLEINFLTGRARGMRLQGCRAAVYVFDQHLTSLEHALKSREQALEGPQTPPDTRARLRHEIKELEDAYRRAGDELSEIELRCLAQQ